MDADKHEEVRQELQDELRKLCLKYMSKVRPSCLIGELEFAKLAMAHTHSRLVAKKIDQTEDEDE